MPGETSTIKKPENGAPRHRKSRKGSSQAPRAVKATLHDQQSPSTGVPGGTPVEEEDEDEEMCHICAEPMDKKAYAVAECNHRTCYTCALRLRALYKRLDCTFCKVYSQYSFPFLMLIDHSLQKPQPLVIITASKDRLFESYAPSDTPYHDNKLSMDFETPEMMEDCLLLLRFNCPDVNCDHVAVGWPELKHHTKSTHNLLLWLVRQASSSISIDYKQ